MSNITYNFNGKVVLITGSSSGIGATAALLFAKSGANVVITSNVKQQLSEVAENCEEISPNKSKPLQVLADVTKEEDLKKLVETTIEVFGKLDVLINNAGVMQFKPITDPEYINHFRDLMQINFYSSVYLTHLCVEYLAKSNGNVINTCSVSALRTVSCRKLSDFHHDHPLIISSLTIYQAIVYQRAPFSCLQSVWPLSWDPKESESIVYGMNLTRTNVINNHMNAF